MLVAAVCDRGNALANAKAGAGNPVKVFGAKETDHNKLNERLGIPDDPSTKELYDFVDQALKQ